MADEEEKSDISFEQHARDLQHDNVFAESVKRAQHENYLGTLKTVELVVRNHVNMSLNAMQQLTDPVDQKRSMGRIGKQFGKIMLGKDENYPGVPGWNQEGRIDVSLAESLNLLDKEPDVRMSHVLLLIMDDVLDLALMVGNGTAVLEEQVRGQLDSLMERWAGVLVGYSNETQLATVLGSESTEQLEGE